MSLASLLPKPVHSQAVVESESEDELEAAYAKAANPPSRCPPYGQRRGFVPRNDEDYGDGGAFPEVHVAQYPLGMGRKGQEASAGSGALQLAVDSTGKVKYDALLRAGSKDDKIIHSTYDALLPADVTTDQDKRTLPAEEDVEKTTEKTKAALQKIVGGVVEAGQSTNVKVVSQDATYIRYTPANQGESFNSGSSQRIIRMVDMQVDPMQPPKFKTNKKIPKGPGSPPAPVMHSPPRKVSTQEQQDWRIPPCISNWKNSKGYTIPLDKRKAADGRGTQDVTINDNFSKLTEALYIAEAKSREAIQLRQSVENTVAQREKERTEEKLRNMAMRARDERAGIRAAPESEEEPDEEALQGVREREELRRDRAHDRQRERNIANAAPDKRNRLQRDKDRDVSERIALGLPATGGGAGDGGQAQYDSRLYNQSAGMSSGFGAEDGYSVYDKAFRGEKAQSIYKPSAKHLENADDEYEKLVSCFAGFGR